MPQPCELTLDSGRPCNVDAVGRCLEDERAFCRSHVGYRHDAFGALLSYQTWDFCLDCEHRETAVVASAKAALEQALAEAPRSLQAAAQRLASSDLQPQTRVIQRYAPGTFFRRGTTTTMHLEPAWPLGRYEYADTGSGDETSWHEIGLTQHGQIVCMSRDATPGRLEKRQTMLAIVDSATELADRAHSTTS